ncbi:MAG: NADH-quinone oxidoreductase subunit H [Candidatus Melainabacteria bacterium]|nr:NADH-quinone oxidoreductase subunit H [Candidatus Melainabacteria bacterium]
MKIITLQTICLIILQLLVVLALSPFINTLMKKLKAILQSRQGPPLMQGYYDLLKYFHKETVVSNQTSWVFLVTPFIVFTSVLVASLIVPTFVTITQLYFLGGIILLIYLFGLGRFFMCSAAMEPGSGFCGMASSREMMLSMLIEPVMLLSLFVLTLMAGSTNLPVIVSWLSSQGINLFTPGYVLAAISLLIAGIAEMGRVPFDNPETHYELTMIHEGMLLEYSGKLLGLMFWASWIKQLLVISLLANLFFPWGYSLSLHWSNILPAFVFYLIKIFVVCIVVVLIETMIAKVRLFRVKDILVASFVISIIALVISIHKSTGGLSL